MPLNKNPVFILFCLQYILNNLIVISGINVYLSLFPFPNTLILCSFELISSTLTLETSSTLSPEQKARISQHLYFKLCSLLNIFKKSSLDNILGIFLISLLDGSKKLFKAILKQTKYNSLIEATAKL